MPKPPPAFSDKESAILVVLYEEPQANYSSYTLTQRLNPTVRLNTPEYREAFAQIRDATEELIVQGRIRGKRFNNPDGVYFEALALTNKGEQTAIQERRRIAKFNKELPDFIKQANAVAAEMKKSEDKK